MAIRPIFLFALPRSGSTLVQRVIAAHPEVATASEPWVLLPLLYGLREAGARAEYWHRTAVTAIEDLWRALPAGRDEYLSAVRAATLELYEKAATGSERYFLDKTPRYHLVAEDVIRAFPDGRFVFLWRHPLSVLASTVETFAGGRFQPYEYRVDLFDGPINLARAWERHAERCCAVRYEDLLEGEDPWRRIFDYLELDFDAGLLSRFAEVELAGRYGDPSGRRRYDSLTAETLGKWRTTLASPVRVAWARRYLRRLGSERLGAMGYDLDAALAELDQVRAGSGRVPADVLALGRSAISETIRWTALRVPDAPVPRGPLYPGEPGLWRRQGRRLRALGRHARAAARRPR